MMFALFGVMFTLSVPSIALAIEVVIRALPRDVQDFVREDHSVLARLAYSIGAGTVLGTLAVIAQEIASRL